MLRNFIIILQF